MASRLERMPRIEKSGNWADLGDAAAEVLLEEGFEQDIYDRADEDARWLCLIVNGRTSAAIALPADLDRIAPGDWPRWARLHVTRFLDDAWSNAGHVQDLLNAVLPNTPAKAERVLDITQEIVRRSDDFPDYDIRAERVASLHRPVSQLH